MMMKTAYADDDLASTARISRIVLLPDQEIMLPGIIIIGCRIMPPSWVMRRQCGRLLSRNCRV